MSKTFTDNIIPLININFSAQPSPSSNRLIVNTCQVWNLHTNPFNIIYYIKKPERKQAIKIPLKCALGVLQFRYWPRLYSGNILLCAIFIVCPLTWYLSFPLMIIWSLKYHLMFPAVVVKRAKEIGNNYRLKVLLCIVDIVCQFYWLQLSEFIFRMIQHHHYNYLID